MEAERPKQKKKTKPKTSKPSPSLADVDFDIDFPSTSTAEDIPSQECFVAKQLGEIQIDEILPIECSNSDIDTSQVNYEALTDSQTECSAQTETQHESSAPELSYDELAADSQFFTHVNTEEPTAPAIEPDVLPAVSISHSSARISKTSVLYPSLEQTQADLLSFSNSSVRQAAKIKPFTFVQLNALYTNPEIECAQSFERDFIHNELKANDNKHPLFELLSKYSRCRYALRMNRLDVDSMRKGLEKDTPSLWKREKKTVKYQATCADGVVVHASESYDYVTIDEPIFDKVSTQLNELLNMVSYNCALNVYSSEIHRLHITQLVQELVHRIPGVNAQSPVALQHELDDSQLGPIREIRAAVTILFNFLRRSVPDKIFVSHLETWLQTLVAVLLRTATWQDHLFLMFHVLRCPAGVSEWATSFIQIPQPERSFDHQRSMSFASPELNHCVTLLQVLLQPVDSRQQFLANAAGSPRNKSSACGDGELALDPVREDMWILVDSDGEDNGSPETNNAAELKEKDLISFLNQIPMRKLFSSVILAERLNEAFTINEEAISGHHLLQLIAFSTQFVKLLGDGLRTYDTDRYRQFAKLLSRLIRHTVIYVAESHTIFGRNSCAKDEHMCARVRVEFDMFVLRAANYIYQSRCLGTWQYLAMLPFGEVSAETVWRLYFFLVTGGTEETINDADIDFKGRCTSADILIQFYDAAVDIPAEDLYYLLQTFSSMALSRMSTKSDHLFVERVTQNLFEIGFVNPTTKELCYKVIRDLLSNLCTEDPTLITTLLICLKSEFKSVETSGSYLFKSLPLDRWQPTIADFEIGATWLLNFSFETPESSLARLIFSRLNWNFREGESTLFLDHDLHVRTACLIAEVITKHVPETVGVYGITESVRQVSNLVKGQSSAEQFTWWCWNMVTVLRLHCMDQSPEYRSHILRHPSEAMRIIPELEKLASVYQGVTEARPMALFLSIMCSQWGHSVPQICHKGFQQMLLLLQDLRQSKVIRCLQVIAPMFLECPESLSKCEAFKSIINQLLIADRTYMKMAKDMISNDYPGPVVEMFGQMLQAQCMDHFNYGLPTPQPFVMLWIQCLTNAIGWARDTNAVYLVNLVLGIAFQSPETWFHAKEYFRFMYTKTEEQKQSKSSFFPFLGRSDSYQTLPTVSVNTMWMSLIASELEHEMLELQPKLWPELLRQIHLSPAKTSLDSLIKKSAQAVGLAKVPTSAELSLFKWANLILVCPTDHHLLPLLCQRFFELYLARVKLTEDETRFSATNGVADRFYEHNVALMKRVKKFFGTVEAHYKDESLRTTDNALASFYGLCSRLFGTFGLWLEETRLNQANCSQYIEFPPQYDANRLANLYAGNTNYWMDFLHLPTVRANQQSEASRWQKSVFRCKSTVSRLSPAPRPKLQNDPKATLLRLLESYDDPVAPPKLTDQTDLLRTVPNRHILAILKKDMVQLNANACAFNTSVQELNFTDCNYKDLIRVLYSNRQRQCNRTMQCSRMLSSNSCKGPRNVTISITDPIVDERIKNKLERNREKHELIIERQMTAPTDKAVLVFVRIQHHVRQVLANRKSARIDQISEDAHEVTAVGVAMFYQIIDNINEYLNLFPPSNELLTDVLSQLGVLIVENQSAEGIRLLQTALRKPHLVQMLSEIFSPSTTAPVYFLEMYKFVVESHMNKCDSKILFVLLSKFDVAKWLVTFMPKLADINKLLKLIVQGLESWNQPDAALVQGVLRRHLVHIFEYDFPEHYGEVLQVILLGCSDQRLLPSVLHDVLVSIYQMAQSTEPHLFDAEAIVVFATTQQIFPFKVVVDTLSMFARHFQTERLQHGLHGLYPKHKDYCETLAILLQSYGHSIVVTAVYAYPGLLADKLLDWLWPSLCDTFSPWLVPYYPQSMQPVPANWIRQVLANNDVLLPWSELYVDQAQRMIATFVDCACFLLDTLPGSEALLGHIFHWYEVNFGKICVPRHILQPLHAALVRLPWDRFKPLPIHIECIHRNLQQFLPECHSFMGHVFLRIAWQPWLQQQLQIWDPSLRQKMLSSLLLIFTKLSFEPNVRESAQFGTVLLEASTYPWYWLDIAGIESVFDSFLLIAEPSIVLGLSSEHGHIDAGVLSILQAASSMHVNSPSPISAHQIQAKRILYVKTIVRLLRLCGSKYQQLLSTKDGQRTFHATVLRLLDVVNSITSTGVCNESDTGDLVIEIVGSLQLPGEFTSRLFVEAIISWLAQTCRSTAVLRTMLNAIGTCKVFTHNVIALLEAALSNYFRHPDCPSDQHVATWKDVFERLGSSLPVIEGNELVQRHNLLTLHLVTILKLRSLTNVGEKFTLLQKLHLILENYKTNDLTEPKLVAMWGLMIVFGVQHLRQSNNSTSLLLTLGRYLQAISTVSEGWGDGVLGAIGLRRDTISKRRRLTTRCLACVVFSLFPNTTYVVSADLEKLSCEFLAATEELINTVQSKKYAELRSEGLMAIEIVRQPRSASEPGKTIDNVCAIMRLFYSEATFMRSLEDVWTFDVASPPK